MGPSRPANPTRPEHKSGLGQIIRFIWIKIDQPVYCSGRVSSIKIIPITQPVDLYPFTYIFKISLLQYQSTLSIT